MYAFKTCVYTKVFYPLMNFAIFSIVNTHKKYIWPLQRPAYFRLIKLEKFVWNDVSVYTYININSVKTFSLNPKFIVYNYMHSYKFCVFANVNCSNAWLTNFNRECPQL